MKPTEKQIAFLRKYSGFNDKRIMVMTRDEASKIIADDIAIMKERLEEESRDWGDDGK